MAVDDAYTKVLLHMDGADASTTFTDESGKIWTASNNAQLDTAYKKFGAASALFDGTGDYISTPDHADLNFGSGDFTIDFWCKVATQSGSVCLLGKRTVSWTNAAYVIQFNNTDNTVRAYASLNGTSWATTNTGAMTPNTETHVAWVRNGTSIYLFINGVLTSTQTIGTGSLVSQTHPVHVGGENDGAESINGWIDELRISKGIARWTANFTPPTAPYGVTNNFFLMF